MYSYLRVTYTFFYLSLLRERSCPKTYVTSVSERVMPTAIRNLTHSSTWTRTISGNHPQCPYPAASVHPSRSVKPITTTTLTIITISSNTTMKKISTMITTTTDLNLNNRTLRSLRHRRNNVTTTIINSNHKSPINPDFHQRPA